MAMFNSGQIRVESYALGHLVLLATRMRELDRAIEMIKFFRANYSETKLPGKMFYDMIVAITGDVPSVWF